MNMKARKGCCNTQQTLQRAGKLTNMKTITFDVEEVLVKDVGKHHARKLQFINGVGFPSSEPLRKLNFADEALDLNITFMALHANNRVLNFTDRPLPGAYNRTADPLLAPSPVKIPQTRS